MNRQFSLAGLLRLRQAEQTSAESGLAAANSRSASLRVRRAEAREVLAESDGHAGDSASLLAIAAARASSQSMLAELDALVASAEADADAARAEYTEAKRRAVGLEKLEVRHDAAFVASLLNAEQGVLDEIASTSWHRKATP
ncbi:flagellar FliJ family protein [Paenarthrobacter nitroguajacolicus]|uniref:flagellar FliJ family protein n=1 Tax=Paenarthrobacter nitroguajacolicus TaxID=211146 RepID=UPI002856E353|nr:flagellar FliJ family protein [Paenarthrobacter nitroguajacolicus]MDR6637211.1 flagellar FliJ protein [Paenarthrobacter nitroguajacolicus]